MRYFKQSRHSTKAERTSRERNAEAREQARKKKSTSQDLSRGEEKKTQVILSDGLKGNGLSVLGYCPPLGSWGAESQPLRMQECRIHLVFHRIFPLGSRSRPHVVWGDCGICRIMAGHPAIVLCLCTGLAPVAVYRRDRLDSLFFRVEFVRFLITPRLLRLFRCLLRY